MSALTSNLPLQDMIAGVIRNATEKLAADENPFAAKKSSTDKSGKTTNKTGKTHATDKSAKTEKTAALTDPEYIEKLASAIEYINSNLGELMPQSQGVIQQALTKMASAEQIGAGRGATSLPTNEAGTKGKQKVTKDTPAGPDASKSEAGAPMGTHGLPGGKTLLENDMNKAPGQSSGSVPTATYPEKGPLVNIKKFASVRDYYAWALNKVAEFPPKSEKSEKSEKSSTEKSEKSEKSAKSEKTEAEKSPFPFAKSKTASARDIILQKLAGEDVLKANIDGGGTTSPLAGKGQLTTTTADQASPKQPGDPTGGFGNEARKHIGSNAAAINYTKRDAKGPVKKQLRDVLDEPALSAKHDSTLKNNLRSTGQAGVKIAAARAFLEKIANEGCTCNDSGECKHCAMRQAIKTASQKSKHAEMATAMGAGSNTPPAGGAVQSNPNAGGQQQQAEAGEGADGCTCGNAGECRVCKLKAALAAARAESQKGGTGEGGGEQGPIPGSGKDF